jgi:hypothetical protein
LSHFLTKEDPCQTRLADEHTVLVRSISKIQILPYILPFTLWGHPIWTHDFRPTPTGWRRDCNIVRQESKWRGRVIIDARGFTAVQGRDWLQIELTSSRNQSRHFAGKQEVRTQN